MGRARLYGPRLVFAGGSAIVRVSGYLAGVISLYPGITRIGFEGSLIEENRDLKGYEY